MRKPKTTGQMIAELRREVTKLQRANEMLFRSLYKSVTISNCASLRSVTFHGPKKNRRAKK